MIGGAALQMRRLTGGSPEPAWGSAPAIPAAKTAGQHPDAEDADSPGMEPGPDADRGARAQGQCLRGRPRSSPLDRGAAQWRRAGRRGHEPGPPPSSVFDYAMVSHDAARRRHGGERQPHHAAARRRWRRHGGNPRGVSGRPEPAVRHGARGRHVLRRQHRRRGGLSLHGGRQPHHRSGATSSSTFKPAGHWTRSLLLSPDRRKLYAGVGSLTNIAENGMEVEEGRAAIYELDLATGSSRIFASGLRNAGRHWPGSPIPARCGPWSTSATGWATRRRPTI